MTESVAIVPISFIMTYPVPVRKGRNWVSRFRLSEKAQIVLEKPGESVTILGRKSESLELNQSQCKTFATCCTKVIGLKGLAKVPAIFNREKRSRSLGCTFAVSKTIGK